MCEDCRQHIGYDRDASNETHWGKCAICAAQYMNELEEEEEAVRESFEAQS